MKAVVALLLLACAVMAQAQTQPKRTEVYRCGPDGRDLRDSPCPDAGAARAPTLVDYDQPGAADSKAARERHLAEARQADALARARRASEAESRAQRKHAVGLQNLPPPPQAASAPPVAPPKRTKGAKPPKPAKAAGPASGPR
jgi:hypothetical protein